MRLPQTTTPYLLSGVSVYTGPNGICESAAMGDDVQEIAVGNGIPGIEAITPGPDGTLNSVAAGDDIVQDGLFPATAYPYVLLASAWGGSGGLYGHPDGDVADQPGVPAQGPSNENPPGSFPNHYIIGYNGGFYDPSYGIGPVGTANEYENEALSGFYRSTDYSARKNHSALLELTFTPSN